MRIVLARPLDSYPPIHSLEGYPPPARVMEVQECVCKGLIYLYPDDEPRTAVAWHNSTPEHQAWRMLDCE